VDEIAYNTADLDDALEAELLDLAALRREVPAFGDAYTQVEAAYPSAREQLRFNEALKKLLDGLVTDLIETTLQRVQRAAPRGVDDIRNAPGRLAAFSADSAACNVQLKRFLFAHVYEQAVITEDRNRSVRALEELFHFYLNASGSMPASHEELARSEPRHLAVCDYIAGMTDQFLLRQHRDHLDSATAG
jgi:dGTPase